VRLLISIAAASCLTLSAHAAPATRTVAAKRSVPARRSPTPGPAGTFRALTVSPAAVSLDGSGAAQTLLVTGVPASGPPRDLTSSATFVSSNPKIVQVGADGVARIVGNGSAQVQVKAGGRVVKVPVRAVHAATERPLNFTNDIVPVLSRTGCYMAACHAKQGGKSGFQLSVLAFDPQTDYAAVVQQGHGRRVNRLEPERSLLLAKATLQAPHGGGQRFKIDSPEYRLLARWIAEGAPFRKEADPVLTRLEVEPSERVMEPKRRQKLLVTALYSDGKRRDVTGLAQYASNESGIAEVGADGIVRASEFTGEAALMVRYMGQVAVARITVPLPNGARPESYAALPRQNYLDDLVYRKLSQLNLLPSALCDDATFLRRASLDLIGTLPTAEEAKAFLAECDAENGSRKDAETQRGEGKKEGGAVSSPTPPITPTPTRSSEKPPALKARARLVERLLERPEYADYWGMRWSNLLLVNPDLLLPRGAFAFDWWLRESFRANKPYDQFVREILTASGETYREGPPNFYRALATPPEAGKAVSQLFLGVRLDCAQCHHHPFERWGQDDFYSLAAYFARVKSKSSYPEGYMSIIYPGTDGEVKHPKTDQVMPPRPLGGTSPEIPAGEDRREALAKWLTAPENPYFAREIVNRTWALLLGRGIVEPVDDFRVTNPATNEPLLDALAKDFVSHGYDLKYLLRTIAASAAYQRSSVTTPNNARDTHNYSHFYTRRMPAEVLLDSVGQVTGVRSTFRGHPEGTRAIRMWDSRLEVEFLEVFGRPVRQTVCECERTSEGSVTQMLHLMNSGFVQDRLTAKAGTVTELEKSELKPEEIITRLYLTYYSRYPVEDELRAAQAAFTREKVTRRAAIEDLMWAMLNSAEFLLNH